MGQKLMVLGVIIAFFVVMNVLFDGNLFSYFFNPISKEYAFKSRWGKMCKVQEMSKDACLCSHKKVIQKYGEVRATNLFRSTGYKTMKDDSHRFNPEETKFLLDIHEYIRDCEERFPKR